MITDIAQCRLCRRLLNNGDAADVLMPQVYRELSFARGELLYWSRCIAVGARR